MIFGLILGLFVSIVNISIAKNPIQAQVGTEPEIFRVIMTIFGVDKSKGDVIAIITVNNGEASRVKLFESDTFPSLSSNLSSMAPVPTTATKSNSGIVEYVATFPNVTVDSGQEYQACVITTQNLDLICKTGFNSPAARPEFVDLSLDTENTAREAVEEEE
ncbi:MAG TPA: hypothetical protein VGK47_11145 [Nitrososphaeraceae archaeon]